MTRDRPHPVRRVGGLWRARRAGRVVFFGRIVVDNRLLRFHAVENRNAGPENPHEPDVVLLASAASELAPLDTRFPPPDDDDDEASS
jgi:hypothetical protein